MITGFGGSVVLSWSSLYIGILWAVAGMICTLFTRRRGIHVAVAIPIVVSVLPAVLWVGAADGPTFEWFRFGGALSPYWNVAIIPVFASVVGSLIGELILPSELED